MSYAHNKLKKIRCRVNKGTATQEEMHEYITKTKKNSITIDSRIWKFVTSVPEVVKAVTPGEGNNAAGDQSTQ